MVSNSEKISFYGLLEVSSDRPISETEIHEKEYYLRCHARIAWVDPLFDGGRCSEPHLNRPARSRRTATYLLLHASHHIWRRGNYRDIPILLPLPIIQTRRSLVQYEFLIGEDILDPLGPERRC